MNAKEYFEEVVRPLAKELKGRRNDRGFIMAVAIVTFHVTDWIAAERNEEKHVVRGRISDRFPGFKYLRAVANAHKHMNVDNPPEFKGLANPLSRTKAVPVVDRSGRLLLANGRLALAKLSPKYVFTDGKEFDPLALIEESVSAIAVEFE